MSAQWPVVRLAVSGTLSTPAGRWLRGLNAGRKEWEGFLKEPLPLLMSYFYVLNAGDTFDPYLKQVPCRDWVLDSGAYSAANSGKAINLEEFTAFAKKRLETDPLLTEVFALDVIGDPVRSMENTRYMHAQGVHAIPCFHVGEPWEFLEEMKVFPKIALGGLAMKGPGKLNTAKKIEWCEQCFARVWPKKIHGFGLGSERIVSALPFHSTDASSWETGPACFGNWRKYGKMSWKGSSQNYASEAHLLPSHDGKCARLHGHSWRMDVTFAGGVLEPSGPKSGMLLDYSEVKGLVEPIVEQYLDHHYLNETTKLTNPTSEELARWVHRLIVQKLGASGLARHAKLRSVTVHETCTCACEYRID